MILIFLHGAPATGKYTIACELAALTGFELYHNHLVVDEVLARHPFGTAEFVAERDQAWRNHFTAAASDPERRLIFTFNPENTVPQTFIDWLFRDLPVAALHSVGLQLPEPEIEARLDSPQRQKFRKLTDLQLYRQLRASGTFASPVIPRTDLWLSSTSATPQENADRIAKRFLLR